MDPGARYVGDGRCEFVVWAPARRDVRVKVGAGSPVPLARGEHGVWRGVAAAAPGDRYVFVLDGDLARPDPASAWQPDGVHAASAVVDHGAFAWTDAGWSAPPLARAVIYELHVGTFTPAGTFAAVIERLDDLRDLGVTALELMPVAEFPGRRNWGYDGAYPFAAQSSYGGPEGLRRLVDACHARGLAVVLDVVYNHFGPEGSYVRDFGPYFTDRYRTPWGDALNFDGPDSDQVRAFFLANARAWFAHYHVDALRLDAVHAITDLSARPFLQELAEETAELARALGRRLDLIAESDLNDARVIRPASAGGLGLQAQWSDDFHHALHVLLTGERGGYFEDFGRPAQLRRALDEAFVYAGDWSPHRRRRHGNAAADLPCDRFVVALQNHDQVGNRPLGERLAALVDRERLKLAAGALLLSPYVPLLFMGEEYGEPAPFLYFVEHGHPELVAAVREGRAAEFAAFRWAGEPPDPQGADTFARCRLDWSLRGEPDHAPLLALHRELCRLRREEPALQSPAREDSRTLDTGHEHLIALARRAGAAAALVVMNVGPEPAAAPWPAAGRWARALDTRDERWAGPGPVAPPVVAGGEPARLAAWELALYRQEVS